MSPSQETRCPDTYKRHTTKRLRTLPFGSDDATTETLFTRILDSPQAITIPLPPFSVEQPAPFIEIFDNGCDVISQHSFILVRSFFIFMNDADKGTEQCLRHLADSPAQIQIFGIHEIPFIESAHRIQHLAPHEHEASRQRGNLHHLIVTAPSELIFIVVFFLIRFDRNETSPDQIHGRRKQLAKVLHIARWIKDPRHRQAAGRMLIHERP